MCFAGVGIAVMPPLLLHSLAVKQRLCIVYFQREIGGKTS